jgi:hypothetical protein
MLPTAIEISGFRSFGRSPMFVGALKKLNFFVGQNNSGKSNVLRAITILSSIRGPEPILKPRSSDFAPGVESVCVYLHFPNSVLKELLRQRRVQQINPELEQIDEGGSFAYPFTVVADGSVAFTDEQVDHFFTSTKIEESQFRQLVNKYLGMGADTRTQARHLMQALGLENYLANKVLFVPHIRTVHSIKQYVENVDQFIDSRHPIVFSGDQMIDLLFRLQHPPYDARGDKLKFSKIIQFLRDITQSESLSLEVPHDKSSILVNMDGKPRFAI